MQTEGRLIAERLRSEHLEEICRLYQDPKVMRTLSVNGETFSEAESRQRLQKGLEHWERYGFGQWVFRDRTDGRFVGRGGLMTCRIDGRDEVELSYAVVSELWGRGFATEMARIALEVGFEQLGLEEMVGFTLPINMASQRVMAKVGFRYERGIVHAGLPHLFYRLTAAEWRNAASTITC